MSISWHLQTATGAALIVAGNAGWCGCGSNNHSPMSVLGHDSSSETRNILLARLSTKAPPLVVNCDSVPRMLTRHRQRLIISHDGSRVEVGSTDKNNTKPMRFGHLRANLTEFSPRTSGQHLHSKNEGPDEL